MIPQKVIEEIRERTDIVQLVGQYLDLKRAGRNFKALCPFHGEKTPSFMVHPEKQIYHCFGCGKGGNVFHFLMDYEGIGFVEAVEKLGKALGIEVEGYAGAADRREKLEPFYRAMEFAARFYRKTLLESRDAETARRYLERRGLDPAIQDEFTLGCAPPAWDALYRAAMEAKVPRETLLDLGLIAKSKGQSGFRDYFRNRVIFPIESLSGRFIGLAGRVLDDSEPKYLNTAESPIYYKGKVLYGMNHSKEGIRKDGTAIIVEGYMDYLMLWKNGFRNVAAVCGTSFTQDQGRLLARYANRIYIMNDGDRAGVRASVRAADELLITGLESSIVVLPDGEDPDSFVKKNGAEELRTLMRSAPNYFAYLKGEALGGERTTYRKDQVIKHLLASVSSVPDAVRRELLVQEIAGLFGLPAETLRGGLASKGKPRDEQPAAPEPRPRTRRQEIQKKLFRLALEDERYARTVVEKLEIGDLEGTPYMDFFQALDAALREGIDVRGAAFAGGIEDAELSRLVSEIALEDPPPGPHERWLEDTIVWLRNEALKDELETMKKRLRELEAEGDPRAAEEMRAITEAYREVSRRLKGIKAGGGASN